MASQPGKTALMSSPLQKLKYLITILLPSEQYFLRHLDKNKLARFKVLMAASTKLSPGLLCRLVLLLSYC